MEFQDYAFEFCGTDLNAAKIDRIISPAQRTKVTVSPTSPTFDVSPCAATGVAPVFPLQIGFVEAAWEVQAKLFEKDSLVVAGLRDAAGADFVTVFGG